SQEDKQQALAALKTNAAALDESQWAYQLISLYTGDMSEHTFLSGISEGVKTEHEYAQRLCEAYFYLAKMHQAAGEQFLAADYFRLALSTNVHEFIEYKYARLELELMAGADAS
ncbi:MAG: lipoprotein NlpI, partial [Pseudoalteromonas sp.]|nr:lipoprotein NlpI [Pseudoalteromonas sp.]